MLLDDIKDIRDMIVSDMDHIQQKETKEYLGNLLTEFENTINKYDK